MIKFFRRIRQRLLTENKTSKYLLYAIGEIVLVVIGILIALQINNWNEENANHDLERDLLIGLHSDLVQDTIQINDRFFKSYNDLTNSLALFDSLVALERDRNTVSLFDSIFERCTRQRNTFWPISGTYKSIVNNGTSNLFRNKDLFKRIQNLHDRFYEIILNSGIGIDEFSRDFRYKLNYVRMLNTEDRLLFYRDPMTRNELVYWYGQIEGFKRNIDSAKQRITAILVALDQEISTSS